MNKYLLFLLPLLLVGCGQTKQIEADIIRVNPCVDIWERYENYFGNKYLDTTYGGDSGTPTMVTPMEYPREDGTWSENGDDNKTGRWSKVTASKIEDIGVCVWFSFDFAPEEPMMIGKSNSVKMFIPLNHPDVAKLLQGNPKIILSL